MQCAKLNLQERTKPKNRQGWRSSNERPKRMCQKRMVNPEHEEDPRWLNIFERFHCRDDFEQAECSEDINTDQNDHIEDLFLSVQNLKFQGDSQPLRKTRTCFKYKLSDNKNHRMFVKQLVTESNDDIDDRESRLTCYFDDYVKYILNNDRSRPNSEKSSLFLCGFSNKFKQNKAVQVGDRPMTAVNTVKKRKTEYKIKNNRRDIKKDLKENTGKNETIDSINDAQVAFHKSGKRKSLTISRAPSPETIQVIRVDVVCNYSSSSLSDYEDNVKQSNENDKNEYVNRSVTNKSHFANKYLLTKTVKPLDENVSNGAKVTLLCKTYKLSDRSKTLYENRNNKKSVTNK